MRKIEFWYSIGSTYTYLSTQRLAQIETENEVFWGDDRCEDAIKWLSK